MKRKNLSRAIFTSLAITCVGTNASADILYRGIGKTDRSHGSIPVRIEFRFNEPNKTPLESGLEDRESRDNEDGRNYFYCWAYSKLDVGNVTFKVTNLNTGRTNAWIGKAHLLAQSGNIPRLESDRCSFARHIGRGYTSIPYFNAEGPFVDRIRVRLPDSGNSPIYFDGESFSAATTITLDAGGNQILESITYPETDDVGYWKWGSSGATIEMKRVQ